MCESGEVPTGTLTTTVLGTTAPFDGAGQFRYLAGHAVPGVEFGDESHYRRLVPLPHGAVEVELRPAGPAAVSCTAAPEPADAAELARRVRRLLDLDADSALIDATLAGDPALAAAVTAQPGVRLPGSLDAEETLFRTLIGQQISIAAARTVTGNLVRALCGDTGLFPSAAQLAEHGREVLRGPAARIRSLIAAAEALASGALVLRADLPVDELTDRLLGLPGVGPWTAGYVALRLGHPDVLLTGDLVLLQGAARLGLPDTARALADYGARWAPWRSYAGMHLWRAARAA
jgi:AraC family transcriptional regulator, regulatory protein of adaptative response / DNA-3-methyladenine glycosylase II